jgi:GT2 family glycosyltransferase
MVDINKEVTVVIISYKSKKKIINLIKQISNDLKIIVIENSHDKSIKKDLSNLTRNIQLKFSENNGYGSAINLARKDVNTKYFFVLNPDIQKIDENLISAFCNSAKELNNKFGALGPRFENVSEKSHKQSNINENYGQIDSISGSAMFFCSEIFDKNGGFDENFFLYFEETDYCFRSNKNNHKIYQINSQRVYHDIGTSVETKSENEVNELKKLYTWHFIWSKFYYYKKRYSFPIALIIFIPIILRIIFRITLASIFNNTDKKEKYLVRLNGLIASIRGMQSYKRLEK